jgi:iron complex transport system ATP-binding protein
MTTAIAARDVEVHARHVVLLQQIDLDIRTGELVAIVGPNGAGKSTLLGALAGDRPLAAGRVLLHGRDAHRTSTGELALLRAVLPQRSQLSLAFTAREVVQLGGPHIDRALAHRMLAAVDMTRFAERSYVTLSGGEQQRVQLARVLVQLTRSDAAALLLDEPTSALDARHQQLVLGIARRLATAGRAVVVVLHDLTLAARWCDRVVLLAGGRMLAYGSRTRAARACLRRALRAAYRPGRRRDRRRIAPPRVTSIPCSERVKLL